MCLTEGRMEEITSGSSWLTYEDECRPLYQVLTPRRVISAQPLATPKVGQLLVTPDTTAAQRLLIYPNNEAKTFKASWASTERFNSDALQRRKAIEGGRRVSLRLFELTDPAELKRSEDLSSVFVAANQMAPLLKRAWERTVLAVHILVALAIVCFIAGKDSGPLIRSVLQHWVAWMIGVSLLMAVVAVLIWAVASRSRVHDRFLDYRGLAEALRIQFYWYAAGLHDVEVADSYLRYQSDKLHWIRAALRACCIGRVAATGRADESRLYKVFDNWIGEQNGYYALAAPQRNRIAHRLYLWALCWLILAAYGAVLVLHDATGILSLGYYSALAKPLTSAALGVAALIAGYAGILTIEEESRQFARMRTIFGRAERLRARLLPPQGEAPADPHSARRVISELGREALSESGDWILLHRAHPLDLPLKKTEIGILMKVARGRRGAPNAPRDRSY